MARIRNTKKLAQRVDRTYLKRAFPIPRWRRLLTAGFVVAGLAWLAVYALGHDQTPYTSGALTPAHAFLGKNCATCHGPDAAINKKVADQKCKACHEGPQHQAEQVSTPACIDCHVEHRGLARIAGASDHGCVTCHSDLKTKSGKLTVAASVVNFQSHPQFGAIKTGRDTTGLRFNHAKHVGELGQKCGDCHVQGQSRAMAFSHVTTPATMSIPTYAATCTPCHALTIDDSISEAAPHDKPEVVHQFVVEQFTKRGMAAKIPAAEKKLWEETCARCHEMKPAATEGGVPEIVPTNLTARWLPKASFDHSRHQAIDCAQCHAKAATSAVSTDLLLPGIETCRQCHNSGNSSAGATCSECHVYHDWSKATGVDGKFKLQSELIGPGTRLPRN